MSGAEKCVPADGNMRKSPGRGQVAGGVCVPVPGVTSGRTSAVWIAVGFHHDRHASIGLVQSVLWGPPRRIQALSVITAAASASVPVGQPTSSRRTGNRGVMGGSISGSARSLP
jgi:hypothetical protein